MDTQIANELASQLSGYRLRIDGAGLETLQPGEPERATLVHPEARADVRVLYTTKMTLSSLAAFDRSQLETPKHTLVLGPRITEKTAEAFRETKVNYLDRSGNAYIDFGSVLIDVRGRRSPGLKTPSAGGVRGANLFSVKRSQIVFALLAWPELAAAPVRTLAEAAGVSRGQAAETLPLLADFGFFDPSERKISRGQLLLQRWAGAYPAGLGARTRFQHFAGDPLHLDTGGLPAFISGERAVPSMLQGGDTLTVYTNESPGSLAVVNRWVTSRQPNIAVGHKFWTAPGREEQSNDPRPAPAALIYADLLATGDGRQVEVAEELRETHDELRRL
jgi:hypothetical protein